MNDVERLIAGQCCHGHKVFSDCGECVITRQMVLNMRKLVASLFGGNP